MQDCSNSIANALELLQSSAKQSIFWENYINTKAADTLTSGNARPSAAMILTILDKRALDFHEKGSQQLLPTISLSRNDSSQCPYIFKQSSAVIARSSIIRYYINYYSNWGRISIKCWIHKRYPIPRPNGRAMACLLWMFVRKWTTL